ncbi:MAG: hypothetical protein U5K99_10555 [Anaerolineales bacterium]|nr:hypothetical protein [Anaerolineales bacterium]
MVYIRERRKYAGRIRDEQVEETQKVLLETFVKVESQLPLNSYERAEL